MLMMLALLSGDTPWANDAHDAGAAVWGQVLGK